MIWSFSFMNLFGKKSRIKAQVGSMTTVLKITISQLISFTIKRSFSKKSQKRLYQLFSKIHWFLPSPTSTQPIRRSARHLGKNYKWSTIWRTCSDSIKGTKTVESVKNCSSSSENKLSSLDRSFTNRKICWVQYCLHSKVRKWAINVLRKFGSSGERPQTLKKPHSSDPETTE